MRTLNFKIATTVIFGLLLALGIVLYASAEKNETQNVVSAPMVWYFNGGDAKNPNNYSLSQTYDCGTAEETICSIEANNNGGVPLLGSTQLQHIDDALESIKNGNAEDNDTVLSFRAE